MSLPKLTQFVTGTRQIQKEWSIATLPLSTFSSVSFTSLAYFLCTSLHLALTRRLALPLASINFYQDCKSYSLLVVRCVWWVF